MTQHINIVTLESYDNAACNHLECAFEKSNYQYREWATEKDFLKGGLFIPKNQINECVSIWNSEKKQFDHVYNLDQTEVNRAAKELEKNWLRLCNQ